MQELVTEKVLVKNGKYYERYSRPQSYHAELKYDKEHDFIVEVKTEDGSVRVPVKKRNLLTALAGDTVEVSLIEYAGTAIKEAVVENIIKRAKHSIIGKLEVSEKNKDFAFVIPDDRKFRKDIFVPKKSLKHAVHGDRVVCEIIEWLYQDISPEGIITELLGKAGDVETEFKSLIKRYGLTKSFSKEIIRQLKHLEESGGLDPEYSGTKDVLKARLDFRDELIFTIDPVDAKDFDDAVSLDKLENGNYRLGVHIADVSHYVSENSILDEEALKRGTSVYLMNDVVPMLPEKLSNDVCSLREGVERLTFSAIMEIDSAGEVVKYTVSKSIIKSKKRFTYEEAQKILDDGHGTFYEKLKMMDELHRILFAKRQKEGSLDFESTEVKIVIDKKGMIENIIPKHRLDTMRLIEDFMLLANKTITLFIEKQKRRVPFVYRVHDLPDKKKIKELAQFVKQFNVTLNPDSKRSIQKMLEHVKGKPEEALVNGITIRSMSKAEYSEENIGHYGLGFDHYTHFTSPIRRYPDLIVHRILFEVLNGISNQRIKYYKDALPEICRQSTDREIAAVQAEREAIKILQVQFMSTQVGKEFQGIISGISEFGIYIELTENMIEGMVRLKELHDDYYILDERNHQLIGRHKKKRYRLGDKVKVKLFKVDKEKRWIDFVIVN